MEKSSEEASTGELNVSQGVEVPLDISDLIFIATPTLKEMKNQ
jgi:hypothetical protein